MTGSRCTQPTPAPRVNNYTTFGTQPIFRETANFARNNLGPPDANFAGSIFYASLTRRSTVNSLGRKVVLLCTLGNTDSWDGRTCRLLLLFIASNKLHIMQVILATLLLLLLLALQPTVGFSLFSDFLPFRPFLIQLSPPSYSHYLYIFFDVINPSFPWSSFVSPTYW